MAKGDFGDLARRSKKKVPTGANDFIESAKIDGSTASEPSLAELDPQAPRGRWRRKDGQKIELGGLDQQIQLNPYEVKLLKLAAEAQGLSFASYIRSAAVRDARKIIDT